VIVASAINAVANCVRASDAPRDCRQTDGEEAEAERAARDPQQDVPLPFGEQPDALPGAEQQRREEDTVVERVDGRMGVAEHQRPAVQDVRHVLDGVGSRADAQRQRGPGDDQ